MVRILIILLACLAAPIWAQPLVPVPPELVVERPAQPDGKLADILERGTLIVGVKNDYPPWGFLSDTGEIIGLEVDLARDLADRLGVALKLFAVTSSNRIERVNSGMVDVVIATAGDSEERRLQADLLLPNYYSSGVVVYGRRDLGITRWSQLEGETICLSRGSYYNRALETRYKVKGQYFAGRREALLALQYGRCVGWAFDDTALTRYSHDNPSEVFDVMVPPRLVVPWAIFVAKGQGQATLGRFVSDMIGEWHAGGRILELQDKWGIARTGYIEAQHRVWSGVTNGVADCARIDWDTRPGECVASDPFRAVPPVELSGFALWLDQILGIDLRVFYTAYERGRLMDGLALTLGLSAASILGALVVGVGLSLLNVGLTGRGGLGRVLQLPIRALITVARMTPPILQLYIVFFGLGGVFLAAPELTPGAFAIAVTIFSFYAGATNTIILSHALTQERYLDPGTALIRLMPRAFVRGFDGVVAACVNIVKAAGMASAIAVGELISTINLLIGEGGDVATLMNGLLVFYFLLVLCVIWLFKIARLRLGAT